MTILLTTMVLLSCVATYALVAVMIGGRLGDLLLALSGTPRRKAPPSGPSQPARRASFA